MPKIINLDALVVDTITVNIKMPDGSMQTFDLKDDIPLAIALETMQAMQQAAELNTAGTDKVETVTAIQTLDGSISHILGEIFRHTYPETTDEQISGLLAFNQRLELLKLFFTVLTSRFKVQPSAMDSSASPTVDPAAVATSNPEESLPAEIPSLNSSSPEPND
jgi:hypothetical protein